MYVNYLSIKLRVGGKEGNPIPCYDMGEHWRHHAKWNTPVTKRQILSEPTCMRYLKESNLPWPVRLSWLEHHPVNKRLWVWSPVQEGRVPNLALMGGNRSMFLFHTDVSLPSSLPSCLCKNNENYVLRWGLKNKRKNKVVKFIEKK